jgi:hypothetical protein
MNNFNQDFEQIYASGLVPGTEALTDVVDVRGRAAVELTLDWLAGGYDAIQIRPQFSFETVRLDSDRLEIEPTHANQDWVDATIGEWDATNNRTELFDDVQYLTTHASGTIARKQISVPLPGCTAVRFLVVGDTLGGPAHQAGEIRIRASRIHTP